jgi:hypothetical protein
MNEADRRRYGLCDAADTLPSFTGAPEAAREAGSVRAMQREAVSMAATRIEFWDDYWDFEAMAVRYFRQMAFSTPDGTAEHQFDAVGGDYKSYIQAQCRAKWRALFGDTPWE